jgi:hypothetical protein
VTLSFPINSLSPNVFRWVWSDSSWYDLPLSGDNQTTAAWQAIEIEYLAGHQAGRMSLWIGTPLNGSGMTLKQTFNNLDNDASPIDSVRLGAMGVDNGTRGTLSIDDFDSRRFSSPGMLPDPGSEPVTRIGFIYALLSAKYGEAYTPPTPQHIFTDMVDAPLEAWAELAYNDGIITACQTSPMQFCPSGAVTRTQAAIYLLLTNHGNSYTPPDVGSNTGFNDVQVTAYAA